MPAEPNLRKRMGEVDDFRYRQRVWRGVVTGTSGNLVTVRRTGQTAADTQSYPRLASYSAPATNDEVIMLAVGDGFICLGKVAR